MAKQTEEKFPGPVPEQQTGSQTDIRDNKGHNSLKDAKETFKNAREKLLDINNWHNYSGIITSVFQLTDASGAEKKRKPEVGDLIKISLPAPGPKSGEGFDWVKIEAIEEHHDTKKDYEYFSIRVRPTSDPKTPGNDTAHFFTDAATNTFMIERKDKEVNVGVFGRNEEANTEQSSRIIDKIRNPLIALGAKNGLATPQWTGLINGLLEKKVE